MGGVVRVATGAGAGVSEQDAHELVATRLCKVEGCERTDVPARGRYAGLCGEHRLDQRSMAERIAGIPPERGKSAVETRSLVEQVKRLVPAAKTLERAALTRRAAKAELQAALTAFNADLSAIREAAQEAISA